MSQKVVWWLASLSLAGAVLQKCSSLEFQSPFIPPSEGFLRCENCVKFPRFVVDWHKQTIPSTRIYFAWKRLFFCPVWPIVYTYPVVSALQYSCGWMKTEGFQNDYVNVLENIWKVNADTPLKHGTVMISVSSAFPCGRGFFWKRGEKFVFKQKGIRVDGAQVSFLINKRTSRTSNSVNR